jgi:predicted glycosyltransferase
MRIWIDLTNSPHVNFFAGIIEQLRGDHDILLTCRPLANTIDLLRQKGFEYHVIGSHYGANKLKKALGFAIRVRQLYSFLKWRQIDVAISHSSFYSPVVARWLGVRSIYLNDNEHALGNRISFLCASTIIVPEFISTEVVRRQWGHSKKTIHYPGVKEGIYLSNLDGGVRKRDGREPRVVEIFIRPEPWTAQYYRGGVNFMDDLIIRLKERYRVILMPRDEPQAEHFRQTQFQGITMPPEPLTLGEMASRCSLFIGAGGTMTREAAVLGIPTISVYQGDLLAVDRYLIDRGYMVHRAEPTVDFVDSFLETAQRRPPSTDLHQKGAAAASLIMEVLLNGHKGHVIQGVR